MVLNYVRKQAEQTSENEPSKFLHGFCFSCCLRFLFFDAALRELSLKTRYVGDLPHSDFIFRTCSHSSLSWLETHYEELDSNLWSSPPVLGHRHGHHTWPGQNCELQPNSGSSTKTPISKIREAGVGGGVKGRAHADSCPGIQRSLQSPLYEGEEGCGLVSQPSLDQELTRSVWKVKESGEGCWSQKLRSKSRGIAVRSRPGSSACIANTKSIRTAKVYSQLTETKHFPQPTNKIKSKTKQLKARGAGMRGRMLPPTVAISLMKPKQRHYFSVKQSKGQHTMDQKSSHYFLRWSEHLVKWSKLASTLLGTSQRPWTLGFFFLSFLYFFLFVCLF